MTKENVKQLVSMIVEDNKLTLITVRGEVVVIPNEDMYDVNRMINDIMPKITGTAAVEVDLDDYLIITQAMLQNDYQNEGEVIVRVVEGKEVKGIFFPLKIEVAVKVDEEEIVIPKAETLKSQIQRASETGSPAVTNFMKRIAPVVKDRRHSAEDLMEFMKKLELPLTDNGDIIAYKKVTKKDDHFVDCHTGKVIQNVGYRIYTDAELVDPDRSKSCSNGLHVGSLDFMNSFYGGAMLICLVHPEDFIAVPEYDTTKCRVCSYEVIGVVNEKDKAQINKKQFVSGSKLNELVGRAVKGHIPPFHMEVHVGPKQELTITKVGENKEKTLRFSKESENKTLGKSLRESTKENTDHMINKETINKVKAAKKKSTGNRTITKAALDLFTASSWTLLNEYRKQRKKSFKALGFTDQQIDKINRMLK